MQCKSYLMWLVQTAQSQGYHFSFGQGRNDMIRNKLHKMWCQTWVINSQYIMWLVIWAQISERKLARIVWDNWQAAMWWLCLCLSVLATLSLTVAFSLYGMDKKFRSREPEPAPSEVQPRSPTSQSSNDESSSMDTESSDSGWICPSPGNTHESIIYPRKRMKRQITPGALESNWWIV